MNIESLLAARTKGLAPSPIRKLVPLMSRPGMISLGGGYPNPKTFAFKSVEVTFASGTRQQISGGEIDSACQYGPTDCQLALKPLLEAWHHAKDGVELGDDQVQVLNGAQEGLHISAYLFLEPGDSVAMSEPAYPGALAAFRAFTDQLIPFPVDEEGTVTSALEDILERRQAAGQALPKFIYEVPNGHNPAGVSLSVERRQHLLRIASRFDLLVLEDDPYQLVQLESRETAPTLQSLDNEGRVIRLDSFSKIFAPGLRIGYASGPAAILRYFTLYKQGTNLHTSSMVQTLLAGFLARHDPPAFMELIRANCKFYQANRDCMVRAAREYLPAEVRFNIPREGMFLWFELPELFDAQRMVDSDGTDLKVLLVPGSAFSTTGGLGNCMRASFSMVPPDLIEEGIRRFATMVERERNRLGKAGSC